MMDRLTSFLDQVSNGEYILYAKRLSGNDTLANESHQAGPYIPKSLFFTLFPALDNRFEENPDANLLLKIVSHHQEKKIRAVWYNNKYRNGTRDEARLTQFGGSASPILDPESTGSLLVIAFERSNNTTPSCLAWLAENVAEEEVLENYIGTIDPGEPALFLNGLIPVKTGAGLSSAKDSCWLYPEDIPSDWFDKFPTGIEIIEKSRELGNFDGVDPDNRLIKRRDCEYELFRSAEEAIELPDIVSGFRDIESFLQKAQSLLQRRKSRSGRSLELHTKVIFEEEGLEQDRDFSWQSVSELGKLPDFIFPSAEKYSDESFPENRLRMLAIKTTCKDRWRQILNEADRIDRKHLLTLQQGVSDRQFEEMRQENVQLVVPEPVLKQYKKEIRSEVITVNQFLEEVKSL